MRKAIIVSLSVMALAGLVSSVAAQPMHQDEKMEYRHHRHHGEAGEYRHHRHHMMHRHMMHKKT